MCSDNDAVFRAENCIAHIWGENTERRIYYSKSMEGEEVAYIFDPATNKILAR